MMADTGRITETILALEQGISASKQECVRANAGQSRPDLREPLWSAQQLTIFHKQHY